MIVLNLTCRYANSIGNGEKKILQKKKNYIKFNSKVNQNGAKSTMKLKLCKSKRLTASTVESILKS